MPTTDDTHQSDRTVKPVPIVNNLQAVKDKIDQLAKENDNTEERLRQEQLYQQQIAPTLKRLRLFFSKVANLLNEVKAQVEKCPDAQLKDRVDKLLLDKIHVKIPIFATYEVLHYRIAGFLTNFEVTTTGSLPRKNDFVFQCECFPSRLNETRIHFVDWRYQNEISALKLSLIEGGLSFKVSEEAPTERGEIKMKFDINAYVPVAFEFVGNPQSGKIDLTIRNAVGVDEKGGLCIEHCSFFPEEVNSRLIEAMIRYAIRLPSELHGLTKMVSRSICLRTGSQPTEVSLEEKLDSIEDKLDSIEEMAKDIKATTAKHADDSKQYNDLVRQEMEKLQKEMRKGLHPFDWLIGSISSILSFIISPILFLFGKKSKT